MTFRNSQCTKLYCSSQRTTSPAVSYTHLAQYKKGIHKTKSCWWLRTPGAAANSMSFVYKDKTVMEYGYEVTNTKITVKPAIWVTVE